MPITTDGKVTLDRQLLKDLRRKLGISQEQLAFQCAERSLCVSVASIKRAETSKNILYRTARDIARFYEIDVDQLIAAGEQGQEKAPLQDYITKRPLVVLRCCWVRAERSQNPVDQLEPSLETVIQQYRVQRLASATDELLFIFGAEGSCGTEALQAAYFALSLQRQASELAIPLPLCLLAGIEVTSDQAEADFYQYGHPLFNAAAEQLFNEIPPGIIIADDHVQPQLHNRFLSEPIPQSLTSSVWQIKRQENVWQPSLSLVGRRVELLQFRAILDSTLSFSSAHVICLSGVAGIGKSRLLSEFCLLAEAEGFATHLLSILDFGDQQSHQLIPQLTRILLGLPPDAKPDVHNLEVLNKALDDEAQLPIALTMLGWPLSLEQNRLLSAIDHHVLSERQIQLAVTLLYRQASRHPMLIMIEDLHWADEKSCQYLLGLLQALNELPVILLMTYRPEIALDTTIFHHHTAQALTTINLTRLDNAASTALADQFNYLGADYRKQCIDKSEGNPLFLEYLLRSAVEQGSDQLPFSLQALILSRLGKLDAQNRQAVLTASVLGQRFTIDILLKAMGRDHYDPQALIDQFLLTRRGDVYQFNHALIHDGIYQSIIERDRCQLHQRCANVYLEMDLPLAIKHLHRANSSEVAKHLIPAIRQAASKFQYETALGLIEIGRAIDYAEVNHVSLFLWHAEILAKLGRISESVEVAHEAEQVSQTADQKIQTLLLQANGFNTLDDFSKALNCIEAAESIANKERLLSQLAKIYYLKGNFYFPRGDVETCFNYQQKSLTYASKTGEPELEASALGGLGDAAYAQGKMYSAYDYLRRCLELCREYDLPSIEAPNLFMLGTVRIYQNQFQQALQDTLHAIELAQRVGHKRAEIVARLTAGWIYLDSLQLNAAEAQISKGLALSHEVGAKRFVPFLEESQARLLNAQGNRRQAQTVIVAALKKVESLKAHSFIGPWLFGTQALLSDDERLAEKSLTRGYDLLRKGCIGHNYFRFHMLAMECGLMHGNDEWVRKHQQALREFTADEPTPWSAYYIERADFLLAAKHSDTVDERLHQSLIERGEAAGLQVALQALKQVQHASALS